MTDHPRLIEFAFPLKQTSLDSVHEKNVRHGHISTLHIWPARRPLAACRAALIATLLPDPGTPEDRQELCEKIAGKVVKKMPGGQIVEREKEETEGGVLHWGRRNENAEMLEWFRQEIRKAFGGRAPRVLDPFAGGGAIPLEAMRLGCEATAIDINPVAWFILKCTLEYPQKLASKTLPLPAFILDNEQFMHAFYKAHPHLVGRTKRTKKQQEEFAHDLFMKGKEDSARVPKADLAWHVCAWGQWVLDQARRELARFYPVYADFEPLTEGKAYEHQPMRLVPLKADGTQDLDALNAEFGEDYLKVKTNPRWIAKPTVAYLWARTVKCKNCRATIPLIKTRWLSKKDGKRVLLTMEPNPDKTDVMFGIETDAPVKGGNAAQRREHDKRLGAGTMTRAGADCPCCGIKAVMKMEDIRVEAQDPAKKLGSILTGVVVDGQEEKEYRLPTEHDRASASDADAELGRVFADLPFGQIEEPTPAGGGAGAGRAFSVQGYGMMRWRDLFTPRQLLALGEFARSTRNASVAMGQASYPIDWVEAVAAMLAVAIDRTANYLSTICIWEPAAGEVKQTFLRFALPITWDFAEANPLSEADRYFNGAVSNVVRVLHSLLAAACGAPAPSVLKESAIARKDGRFDLIVTDPPYYDAIPYSDLMDFFYVWLRRTLFGVSTAYDRAFAEPVGPKWDHATGDGELIDDSSRHDGNADVSKKTYEDGMSRAFEACSASLTEIGRLVIVFANKQPDAWETLVSALIRAGFIVDGSWPIVTEMRGGVRNFNRASLASSVWLVCKKRPPTSRPGWDNKVLEDMRVNISQRLRDFWDAGIRGPDFVWAATGPALEAYSKHPVVKMANDPGQTLTVSEFLNHARRMVVDFVVGRVLEKSGEPVVEAAVDRLDEATAYYLLHRNDFGLDDAPAGACILYATACSLSDQELVRDWDLLVKTGGEETIEDVEENAGDDEEPSEESRSGSKVKLKPWNHRRGRSMGYEAAGGRPVPLIDRIHRLMHVWKGGDVHKVDEYLDEHGLRRHELFRRVLQSLIELSKPGSEERSLLESLSNHIGAKGAKKKEQPSLAFGDEE
jgi:adenine-specific DNA methylase